MDTAKRLKGARILILFPHMVTAGGALNYTLRLAEQLLSHGAAVAILVLQEKSELFDVPAGVQVLSVGGPLTSSMRFWLQFPLWQARINRTIAAWKPDVLVPQVFPANWWGWLYKRKHSHAKLAWICHEPSAFIHSLAWIRALQPWWKGLLARCLKPFLRRVDVALARYNDRTIANSRFTASEMEKVYGLVPDGIACPGIDYPSYACAGGPKERAIITVARLTKFKRVDFLLEVFARVLQSHPDLIYHVIGRGEEESALRELVRNLGVEERVVFHGAATDAALVELYQRSSLFLHGSIDEPFGMAPLEAIACGTPVVAHRSGGPAEFVTAECGRLVGSLEVADWAREITAYLEDLFAHPDFPERVRECSRPFDWPVTLRPAVEVIAGLCGEEGRAASSPAAGSSTESP
jgi:glycosyltransferase involved in cell wall biosynthesis